VKENSLWKLGQLQAPNHPCLRRKGQPPTSPCPSGLTSIVSGLPSVWVLYLPGEETWGTGARGDWCSEEQGVPGVSEASQEPAYSFVSPRKHLWPPCGVGGGGGDAPLAPGRPCSSGWSSQVAAVSGAGTLPRLYGLIITGQRVPPHCRKHAFGSVCCLRLLEG
jgi:hypothetical protein